MLKSNLESLQKEIAEKDGMVESYCKLGKDLLSLSEKTTSRVMVPLCDIAFIPARLKHSNEVYVHLGDQHFVQRTAQEC